ncbi:MAG: MATE family efflux transporter, partial [Verrucomicrobia bacterium]|nr:MATE family efflux transporter [Verrucomicrobiota bacterium]
AALSVSFPVFFILIAVSAGISQGATALISNALGEENIEEAKDMATQSVMFSLGIGVILMAAGFITFPFLFRVLGAEGEYLKITLTYMNGILTGTLFFIGQSILNATLNAQGDTASYRNVLILGFILNLILDPWFMYGGMGLPAMGIRGIALATVLIQALGCVYLAWRVSISKLNYPMIFERWKPNLKAWGQLAKQGIPASVNMMTVAAGIFVITWFISFFSKEGVAAYGIATRIEQIILLPTIGLNIAVLTLTGQNNGAGRLDRIKEMRVFAMKAGLVMMISGGLLLFFAAPMMMKFFTDNVEVVSIGKEYLRIASFTLCSYVILFQTVFMLQGLKKPMIALWIGLYRQIVAPCVVFYLLAFGLDWKLQGIWWGIFIVTWSAALFTLYYGNRILNRVKYDSVQK